MGVERKILESIEKFSYKNHDIKVISMKTLSGQQVLIASIKSAVGWDYYIPWGSYSRSYPIVISVLNTWVNIAWAIPNIIYAIYNPQHAIDIGKTNISITAEFRKCFLTGKTCVTSSFECKKFDIKDRDRDMYKVIQQNLENLSSSEDSKFIICLGMLHLSLDNGILFHFEKNGYTLKPAPIIRIE